MAVLFGGAIKPHDVASAEEAVSGESPLGGFLIVLVALEDARAFEAQLAMPVIGVIIIGINKPIESVSTTFQSTCERWTYFT